MELELLDYIRIIWRRKYLVIALVLVAGITSYVGSKLSDRIYEARSKILVLDKKGAAMSILNEISGMPKNQVANYVEILKSRSLLLTVCRRLDLPTDHESLKGLQSNLTVQPIQGTDTIEIRVQSADRRLAQRLANTYVRCFMERSLADNQEDARAAREFIEEQLAVITERLTRAEVALAGYQKSARIVSPSDEVKQAIDKLAQFESNRASLDVALAQARARLAKVEELLSSEDQTLVSAKVLARNPVFERYRQELSNLNGELAAALAQYTEKHPNVVALRAQIAKVQEDLNREMETIVQSQTESPNPIQQAHLQQALTLQAEIMANQAGREAIDKEIRVLDGKLASLPGKEMELARLMREKASSEAIYTLLVTKKSEMEITEHMRTADVRLVDPAYLPAKESPVKPNTRLNVAVAVFLGLFAGAGLAFLLEYLDPSLKTRDEAVAALGLPVFGMIPDDEVFHDGTRRRKRHKHNRAKKAGLGRIGA
ncbi:MAG: GumC family protein [Bacteroidota bacterium]